MCFLVLFATKVLKTNKAIKRENMIHKMNLSRKLPHHVFTYYCESLHRTHFKV
jgi:hypothetical protein